MHHKPPTFKQLLTFILAAMAIVLAATSAHAAPILKIEPTPLYFPSVHIQDGFTTAAFTIFNIGDETLEFGPRGIWQTGSAAFSFLDDPSTAPLATQTSRTYRMKFDPATGGGASGAIWIDTNGNTHSAPTLYLVGTGHASSLTIYNESLNFEHKVTSEGPTRGRRITLRNTGNFPLEFTGEGVSIQGANAGEFEFTSSITTAPLPATSSASSRLIYVSFNPQSPGSKQAKLVITTTDVSKPTVTLELTGLAIEPRGHTTYGRYDGVGPGESTIGTGGDYTSLFDACMDINKAPLTGGDWTFRIVSDLTEQNNSYLGQSDTNGNTITFRPALNTTATVTFTTTTRLLRPNWESYGHFVIGNRFNSSPPLVFPTANILIDGSQTPGGSDTSLYFRRENLSGSVPLFVIEGGCKDITIRNCDIFTNSGANTGNYPLARPVPVVISPGAYWQIGLPKTLTTTNVTVEGCTLQTVGTIGTKHVIFDRSAHGPYHGAFLEVIMDNLIIRNNRLFLNGPGLEVTLPRTAVIDNNHITVLTTTNTGTIEPVISVGNESEARGETSITVTNNTIGLQPGALGTASGAGIHVRNRTFPGTYVVANNTISGLSSRADKVRAGITVTATAETTAIIAHNSVFINDLGTKPPRGYTYGIGSDRPYWVSNIEFMLPDDFDPESQIDIHNNIVHVEQPGASAIHQEGTVGTFSSNNNVLSVAPGAYTSTWRQSGSPGWFETHTTLDDRRTTTGQDMNSVSANPFEPASPGLGTWTRAAAGPDNATAVADLHFTHYPGSMYLAPKIPGIDADIDGDPRQEALVIMGADEVPHHQSMVRHWGLY